MTALSALDPELDAIPGTVSVWCGPLGGGPTYVRHEHATHYAASTMKLAVLAAVYRSAEAGAVDLCLTAVGRPAVAEVWRLAGARHSVVGRGIDDSAARTRGITNLVTAADLAALLAAIVDGRLAGPAGSAEMVQVMLAQERGDDLASGLPPGTRTAHKNGWVTGIRHGAGVVFPDDAPPYALICCTTTPLATGRDGDPACAVLARVAGASWEGRLSG